MLKPCCCDNRFAFSFFHRESPAGPGAAPAGETQGWPRGFPDWPRDTAGPIPGIPGPARPNTKHLASNPNVKLFRPNQVQMCKGPTSTCQFPQRSVNILHVSQRKTSVRPTRTSNDSDQTGIYPRNPGAGQAEDKAPSIRPEREIIQAKPGPNAQRLNSHSARSSTSYTTLSGKCQTYSAQPLPVNSPRDLLTFCTSPKERHLFVQPKQVMTPVKPGPIPGIPGPARPRTTYQASNPNVK